MSENQIVGYDTISDGTQFPRFSGPCKRCGATNYGLSTSGPDFCGDCAMGRPVELIKLQRQHDERGEKYFDALCALSILLNHGFLTDKMRERGQAFIDNFKRQAP